MTKAEAKNILLRYRLGVPALEDTELSQALHLAKTELDLAKWLEANTEFHRVAKSAVRDIEVPAGLREKILAGKPPVASTDKSEPRKNRFSKTYWISALAAASIAVSLAIWWVGARIPKQERFEAFRIRMVQFAERQYRMDIVTNDLSAVRNLIAAKEGPSAFELPQNLLKAGVKGGGRLAWQNHPVGMVCFNYGKADTLYLFVLNRDSLRSKDAPPPTPEIKIMHRLTTASWTEGDKVYILAAPAKPSELQKFLSFWVNPWRGRGCAA